MPLGRRLERYAQLGALAGRIGATVAGQRVGALFSAKDAAKDTAAAARGAEDLARTLGRLRGAAMKFGQSLAVAADHLDLPPEVRMALGAVHAQGEPVPFATVRATVERELGAPLATLFATFDEAPLGTASLAQAHAATLADGRKLVVKVLHEGVEEAVEADLAMLEGMPTVWRALGRPADEVHGILAELRARVAEELDYAREADNIEVFASLYGDDPRVRVPRVVRERSSARVLTLDHLPGRPVDLFVATASRAARTRAAQTLAELFFEQAFRHRVLHADPHPGNYLFEPDGRVGLLDFGCVKRFDAASIGAYARIVRAALAGDRAGALDAARAFGAWDGVDPTAGEAIWGFCEAAVGPWRAGVYEVDEREPSMLGRVKPHTSEMWRHEGIVGPPDVLFLHRTVAGVYALGRRLGARAAWSDIAIPHLDHAIAAAGPAAA